jgi:hypothetical protein
MVITNVPSNSSLFIVHSVTVKVKVKQSHYKPWIGPEGSRSLRLPDFKTIGT